ncbi:MAG: hypothetical protein OEX04_08660 [Acidimicrobiia bacterium]|nr:hypothetical protein [Acidimicrobiia bacterium]MDH4307539.1 hypothetical protein [Acidimicrobiia bacterium]
MKELKPRPLETAHEILIGERRLWVWPAYNDQLASALTAAHTRPGPPPVLSKTPSQYGST